MFIIKKKKIQFLTKILYWVRKSSFQKLQKNQFRLQPIIYYIYIFITVNENTVFIKHEKVLIHTFYSTKKFLEIEIQSVCSIRYFAKQTAASFTKNLYTLSTVEGLIIGMLLISAYSCSHGEISAANLFLLSCGSSSILQTIVPPGRGQVTAHFTSWGTPGTHTHTDYSILGYQDSTARERVGDSTLHLLGHPWYTTHTDYSILQQDSTARERVGHSSLHLLGHSWYTHTYR